MCTVCPQEQARRDRCESVERRANLMNERERIRVERAKVREEFGSLYARTSAILFELDPVGINLGGNTDEYEPEVGTILPRLRACSNEGEARRAIHEDFVRWFDARIAGPEESYTEVAARIWAEWRKSVDRGVDADV